MKIYQLVGELDSLIRINGGRPSVVLADDEFNVYEVTSVRYDAECNCCVIKGTRSNNYTLSEVDE